MEPKFDENFDVVLIGTGLTETIVSAACSRVGKTVLHLDPNPYYGDLWTSFTFSQLLEWNPLSSSDPIETINIPVSPQETIIPWIPSNSVISCVDTVSYLPTESEDEWTEEKLRKQKDWGIDLVPRLLYCDGSMVKLLVSSNISRYLTFCLIEKILSFLPREDQLVEIPCCRQDIFNDKHTTLTEKRLLMRFITLCEELGKEPESLQRSYGDMPFIDFLTSCRMTSLLQHLILNSIAMLNPDATTLEAFESIKKFFMSSGKYGNTPFLYPSYGTGEIPQAFCRLSAIFGATYCLKMGIDAIITEGNLINSIYVDNQRVNCKYLVCGARFAPKEYLSSLRNTRLSRGIFISSGPIILNGSKEHYLLRIPGPIPVYIIQTSYCSSVTPKGIYLVYAWCETISGSAKNDLLQVAKKLFNFSTEESDKPRLLWSKFFNQNFFDCSNISKPFDNLFITSPPSSELDFDFAINEASQIFNTMYPDEKFLPRAPDYDEIVIDGPQVEYASNSVH